MGKADTAVANVLGVDAARTRIKSAGGGGCSSASTSRVTATADDGSEKTYFMKTATGSDGRAMLEGEAASLRAIHSIVPSLCPKVHGSGFLDSSRSTYFMISDFLYLGPRSMSNQHEFSRPMSLAEKLGRLHTTEAPVPDGYDRPMFGFPVPTACGDTLQLNNFREDWADFFAYERLQFILEKGEKHQGTDRQLEELGQEVIEKVVPRLLGKDHLNDGKGVTPVVVHGDLWSGNCGVGSIGSESNPPEQVVFDSSACYAHNEYEIGIMWMFSGFSKRFWEEYHAICPKTSPESEYDDRIRLYELYHILNHYALFGSGYKRQAISSMKSLLQKYG